jgi:hypothetical protein
MKKSTGKAFAIRPVVVFPGWYVDSASTSAATSKGVWLLNPKALPEFIRAERDSIPAEDVKLVSYHLGRYIRAT